MKRFLAFTCALLASLLLCACIPVEPTTGPETAPLTETITQTVPAETIEPATVPETVIPNQTEKAEQLLNGYCVEFNWDKGSTEIVLTSVPDCDMLESVEKIDDITYKITMTDKIVYDLTIDAQTRQIATITCGEEGFYPRCEDNCH